MPISTTDREQIYFYDDGCESDPFDSGGTQLLD